MNGEDSCVRLSLKTCPICKTHVFDDMSTCYNCMYSFGSNPDLEQRAKGRNVAQGRMGVSASKTVEMVRSVEVDPFIECASDSYETPEDCIREYETMLICREKEVIKSGYAGASTDAMVSDGLLQEFLVELSGFLRKFLLDRKIGV